MNGDDDEFDDVAEVPRVSSRLESKTHNLIVQEMHSRAAPVED